MEKQYGEAEEIWGVLNEDDINIRVTYEDMFVILNTERNKTISFETAPQRLGGRYPVNDNDKKIKMPIIQIRITKDKGEPFFRGIKIGESTLEQIKAGYPQAAELGEGKYYGYDFVVYSYVDFDEIALASDISREFSGSLHYYFDEGKLVAVEYKSSNYDWYRPVQ